jgi:hypothetical protein
MAIWYIVLPFGIFYCHLVYFIAIWYIFCHLVYFYCNLGWQLGRNILRSFGIVSRFGMPCLLGRVRVVAGRVEVAEAVVGLDHAAKFAVASNVEALEI